MPNRPPLALRARWVFPVAGPPLPDAAVTIAGERIVAVGAPPPTAERIDLGNVAILPGLVNAHTHLEFSDLSSPLGRPGLPLGDWLATVVAWRRTRSIASAAAIAKGLAESVASGVTTLADIATGDWTAAVLADCPLRVTAFYELIGLAAERADDCLARAARHLARQPQSAKDVFAAGNSNAPAEHDVAASAARWLPGLSPHAPYTVRPDLVARLVALAARHDVPVAMHLAESREELELLAHGRGPLVDFLSELGAWDQTAIPRGTRPLDYLRLLVPAPRALVVHGNYLADDEIAFLAAHGRQFSVVYCPRTHAYFGHDPHPIAGMLARGVRVALGTDSRASSADLSLLAEMRHVARHGPLDPATVLALGTLAGAEALGLADQIGSLAVGRQADLAIVALGDAAAGAADPYELLLAGDTPVLATVVAGRLIAGRGHFPHWPPAAE